ncbi:hypothetical protein JI739_04475 [Ramlibacter sp. AW1]|uniref:Flp family type IVb pilin n=1 Tax=Ramlibacter aurantiacus TaxID=2801330 RepID=A0A937D2C2_9BURK|nr:hypothetical protein [Ramlibacter aurantiacus]MBL0419600.1 hypothetical protein [Ramlibacter aurantiacus]
MERSVRLTRRAQQGAQIIEYSLLIALISLALAAALGEAVSGLPDQICGVADRVSLLMGGDGVPCN